MLVAFLSLINPGDEVILVAALLRELLARMRTWPARSPVYVPLRPPGWTFDPDELAAGFNDRTKAIVLCNPNNPTGTVFTREELEAIAAPVRRSGT